MYRWELDDPAEPEFDALDNEAQALFTVFMDAQFSWTQLTISAMQASPLSRPSWYVRCILAYITKAL
jgi:hypothetical protein